MKIILVAGVRHKSYIKHISDCTIINLKADLTLASLHDYLSHSDASADGILITDGGFLCDPDENIRIMEEFAEEALRKGICVAVLTHDFYLSHKFSQTENIHVALSPFFRITEANFHSALERVSKSCNKPIDYKPRTSVAEEVVAVERKESKWRINIGRKKKPEPSEDSYSNISRALNKTVAFTGRAHSGITSTVVNVAYAAAKKGMSVIILDLDIECRTTNLYFNTFCEMAENSEDISRSLIMTIANPNSYKDTAVSITHNLWLAALGFDFCDERTLENFFTEQKIAALVSALKNKFDFVFVDFPLDIFSRNANVMVHFDVIGLCVENNLHSAITTLRVLVEKLTPDSIKLLNMKSKLIAAKYNDESMFNDEILTPEMLANLMTDDMCEYFTDDIQIAGKIPYIQTFDRQLTNDIPIYETNALLADAYDVILSRL